MMQCWMRDQPRLVFLESHLGALGIPWKTAQKIHQVLFNSPNNDILRENLNENYKNYYIINFLIDL